LLALGDLRDLGPLRVELLRDGGGDPDERPGLVERRDVGAELVGEALDDAAPGPGLPLARAAGGVGYGVAGRAGDAGEVREPRAGDELFRRVARHGRGRGAEDELEGVADRVELEVLGHAAGELHAVH